jgi:hypothetical protein
MQVLVTGVPVDNTTFWEFPFSGTQPVMPVGSPVDAAVVMAPPLDIVAPGQPQSVEVTGGYKGIGAKWNGSDANDLMFYEVRHTKDDGLGAPITASWVLFRTRANAVFITGLALDVDGDGLPIDTRYWMQVRAVDFTGNVVTSTGDVTPVPFDSNPEAGWTTALDGYASPIGANDIAADTITANMIATTGLDAGVITSGLIKVGTVAEYPDGIEMYNGAIRVGKWDEDGIYIGNTTVGLPFHIDPDGTVVDDLAGVDYIRITNAGLTVYKAGVATTAITPEGIDASAITFGELPGGHNVAKNSSFELAGFITVSTPVTLDTIAQFQANDVAGHVNVGTAYTGDKVTMTANVY